MKKRVLSMMITNKDLGISFEENYQIVNYIGRGGNGKVFKVERIKDKAQFALKCLIENDTPHRIEKKKSRFSREISTLKK